ncbi:NAD(P)/FAD-dependent oxidoreductase [Actinomycetospora chibensis]|uniref:NAD(P)/FAD-dependent oxidoreductase n=1 Tax=Actinomycetospora chibensis TaxID=663606 RepID=A0ABV9RD17_9PSEU|nr:FAD-dependent oxidoreductase [Actinomycetospora chibensis]MDD7925075.1 FAD-dependent oxidoreductase [Actinomycetospora chibensis]
MASHLVVVGASLAGLRAVEAVRKDGHDGPVTLIGAERHLPYDRPPLSKAFLEAGDEDPEHPRFREESHLAQELGVELVLGEPASGLDTAAREVHVADRRIGYDALVLATGARAKSLPGSPDLDGVHTLRTLDDAQAIRAALDAGARTVVIGAGFIGSEVASGAHKRGLEVTVLEALPTPLGRAVGEEMGAAVSQLHHRNGMDLRCGVTVSAIEGNGSVEAVVLEDGTRLPADLVVVGAGAAPTTDWLEGSGLELDDGVVCDEYLAAGPPGIYAAGDIARWRNAQFDGDLMRLEHWTSAAEQGAVAARNALDPASAKPYATVPYFWSDWYDSRIQFVGIPRGDEVRVVSGRPEDGRFVALYRRCDHLVGVLAVNRQAEVMKYRAQIKKNITWDDALKFAAQREAAAQDKAERAREGEHAAAG